MSDHPLGLNADPFASPPTLSAEETSHLIQRLVRACGGDGAAIFPLATCTEIHRWAGGRLDDISDLAGMAMRAAAAEGAGSVSPAHVRLALGATTAVEESEPSDAATERRRLSDAAAAPTAADLIDDVPDLPENPLGSFVLPSAPSQDLAPDTRDWVSRFIPSDGPQVAHVAAPMISRTPMAHDTTAVGAPASPGGGNRRTTGLSPAPGPPASPRASARSRRRRSRTHRWSTTERVVAASVAAIAVVCLAAIGLRQLPRGTSHPAAPEPKQILPASRPAPGSISDTPGSAPARRPSPARARPGTSPIAGAPASVAPADSSPTTPVAPQFGLEVAAFIVADRAQAERDRLMASGHRARLLTAWEGGSPIYRVVLGRFPDEAAAERAADELLATGTVQQARVVTLPPKK